MCKQFLPTLSEVPAPSAGAWRDMPQFLRLCLIPPEEATLRAEAIKTFLADERENSEVPNEPSKATQRRSDLSDIEAHTPGGIAWKLATALDYWEGDDETPREWWWYLIESAYRDAVELERRRAAEGAT